MLQVSPLMMSLVLLAQAPAPAPVAAPEPVAAPAAPQMPAAAPATDVAPAPETPAVPANPAHWRVENVPVAGGGQETRVLRSDDTAVSVGEGLADIQQVERLKERARRLDDTQTRWETILGRVAVLVAGGVLLAGGVVAALVGGGFWAWSRVGVPEGLPTQVNAVVLQGASILVTGLAAAAIGLFMVVATAGLWAYFIWRGPPPPDPAVVQAIGAQLNWDAAEAAEVVKKHNGQVDGAPPPGAAPAPSAEAPPPQGAPAGAAPSEAAPPAASPAPASDAAPAAAAPGTPQP